MLKGSARLFRKKPVVIEATQWFKNGDHPSVERPWSEKSDYRCEHCFCSWGAHGVIRTLEDSQDGGHFVCPGDWIITGVNGEKYACKPNIFEATYSEVNDSNKVAVAWLILRADGSKAVVLSPLTDDTYLDEGDEAWPLFNDQANKKAQQC